MKSCTTCSEPGHNRRSCPRGWRPNYGTIYGLGQKYEPAEYARMPRSTIAWGVTEDKPTPPKPCTRGAELFFG